MDEQSNYVDREQLIRLEGRPIEPDWMTLLGAGRNAVQKCRAAAAPFLSEVMWEDVDRAVVTPRPAALDYPLMRRWLEVNEQEAIAYLCDGWGYALDEPEPETATDAQAILSRPLCAPQGHRMLTTKLSLPDDGPLAWNVGYCPDCLRAVLLLSDDTDDSARCWVFYDQEAVDATMEAT
ncbi:hypothetical protein [Brachybacterium sp. J153]|uniref:hypothetical protein n=1 Tax=Brachybacterium sp. J153 TaxID=3116488 RepID=UPI002E78C268|nr:hypothetical protein [Brachybacterium sp. J153]MEE1616989.1 hypothetical protein [Brachybacterium sp. J153]